jgi:2-polyprenyl-6-methoxyphenol hydroxylase-like FAD-dependent oxidoreductase
VLDLAIAGGGPAGLAVAIRAAQAGLTAAVLERAAGTPDKACGEGLMPAGVRELATLGALEAIPASSRRAFAGIRYVQEDGGAVEARFRGGEGLGIRRTALSAALAGRALALGAELRRCAVRSFRALPDRVVVDTGEGAVEARLLVAADGIQSPLRRAAGLASAGEGLRRYGLRRHFAAAPWSDFVEVHWARGLECYVTPVGPSCVNVAFLWEGEATAPAQGEKAADAGRERAERTSFAALLARFPRVAEHLAGAAVESEARGSGPLLRGVRARAGERLALVGDAAGYVDAITGQGLSLAFAGARLLVLALPRPLGEAPLSEALRRYDRSLRVAWLRYALPARGLLALARRPRLRRRTLSFLQHAPRLFGALLEAVAAG